MNVLKSLVAMPEGAGSEDVIARSLATVRAHLGMHIAYLSEFVEGRSVFRAVDAPGLEHLIQVGDSHSLDDVYCQHILDGRLPELIPDTAAEPLCMSLPITAAAPIGSHVSVPIRRADGSVYGMFCCLSPLPNPSLNHRDLSVMKVFAEVTSDQVSGSLAERQKREDMASAIHTVLRDRSFEMRFQPIYDLGHARPSGFEALCRFAGTPYRSPDLWFADAETVRLGADLELAVIAAALEALHVLPADVYLSVNASPATVATGRLGEVFAGRDLSRVVLEVTEHGAVMQDEALVAEVQHWRMRGVRIAVDDAGAGYSGLQQILRLCPDIIKLDISLTRGIDTDPARRALAAALVHFAGETGARIVAEGIEIEAERAALLSLGVHRGQGWLLGRPEALEAAVARCGLPPMEGLDAAGAA